MNVAEEICNKRLYSFHHTVKHTHEYYAHKKMETFITQLRYATHGEQRDTAKYPNIANQPA